MRKKYDEEFKKMIVELLELGRSSKELSIEYEIEPSNIRRWRREYAENNGDFTKKKELTSEQKELKALQKELREVKMERDILKKAVGIFSKRDS